MDDQVITYYGQPVKALGQGKVAGYLVLFSGANDPDLSGEYFTADTDFDFEDGQKATVLYQHGMDPELKNRVLGKGPMTKDKVGVWLEAQLELRDDFERYVYKLAEDGKLGWSSGTIPQRMERVKGEKATWIKSWALGLDASLTPTPCEPRTCAVPLKSLVEESPGLTLKRHTETVLEALDGYTDRITDFVALKVAEDRTVSRERQNQFAEVKSRIDEVIRLCQVQPDPALVAMKLRLIKENLSVKHK